MAALDISDDLSYVDGLETVTYRKKQASTTTALGVKVETVVDISVADVLRRVATRHEEMRYGGSVRAGDIMWEVMAKRLVLSGATFRPKEEDRIKDSAGNSHHIQYVDDVTLRTRFRIFTRGYTAE